MPDSLQHIVKTFYRAFSGDTDLLDGVVTPDWEDIPLGPGQEPGPDGIKPMIKAIGASFTDFHILVHDVIDGRGPDGNGKIGVRAEMCGTHTGDMFGIPATGRAVHIPIHEFHDIQGGRLARTWHLEDWFGFFNQVGQAPQISKDTQ
ncbi:ester cyclase [Nakamurella sp. A5-74]|uniref:Ester cyclase n=1 Tax=Nakamurella sp. A5-74 TaxID=3158264 RepID=A0AAU8DKB6_9ACTN